jgi:hypothetical protein
MFNGTPLFACSAALRATTSRLRVRIIEGCAPTRTLKSQGQSHATPAGTISRHAAKAAKMFTGTPLFACSAALRATTPRFA